MTPSTQSIPLEKKLLLIEDDAQIRRDLRTVLSAQGFRFMATDTAEHGWHLFTSERPDLVILDVGLADGNGLDVCRRVREHPDLWRTPVIVLTGRGQVSEKELGFAAGADQYLVKPVSPEEVRMWADALLRRQRFDLDCGKTLRVGELEIDLDSHLARYKGEQIPHLTVKEFELLCYLVKNRPKVLSRKNILSRLWHTISVDHVVDNHLSRLRKKIPVELSDRIQNVPGMGFRFLD